MGENSNTFLASGGLGAAAAGAQGIMGAIGGAISGHKNRKMIRQLNDMNLDFQREMWAKNRDFQVEMWNKENDYNSAKSQFERYQMAGLNPQLLMGQGSAGTAQSAGTVSSGGNPGLLSPQGYDYQTPFMGAGQALTEWANNFEIRRAEARKANADAEGAEIDNQTKHIMNLETLENIRKKNQGYEQDNLTKRLYNKYADSMFQSDAKYKERQVWNQNMDLRLKQADLVVKNFNNSKLEERFALERSDKLSEIALKYSQGDLTRKQAKTEIAKCAKTWAEESDIDVGRQLKESTFDATVDKYLAEAKYAQNNTNPNNLFQAFGDKINEVPENILDVLTWLVPTGIGAKFAKPIYKGLKGLKGGVKVKGFGNSVSRAIDAKRYKKNHR